MWRRDRARVNAIRVPFGGSLPADEERLLVVRTGYFTAGAVFKRSNGVWACVRAAPIIKWMVRKSPDGIKVALLKMGADWEWSPV